MSASVPTCDYYRQYGKCPCEPECEHFITKKEVDDIVRNMGNIADNMSDLINRQDALKPFCVAPDGTRIPEVDCDNFPVEFSVKFIKKHLLSLPSAEAIHGEWIEVEVFPEVYDIEGVKTWGSEMQCDQCGFRHTAIEGHMAQYNFCPNCGAKMKGAEDD